MSIPKIIHCIWLGSPLPERWMNNIADWQLKNEGWRLQLWTEPLFHMVNEDLYWDASLYVKQDAVWQFRADLMRYEILYRHGGLYVDVDCKPLRPLGDLLDERTEFAVAEGGGWIANTILASEPDTTLFGELVERMHTQVQPYRNAAAGVVSGPQYLTSIWESYGGYVDERTELFFPYSWDDVRKYQEKKVEIPADAYMEHQWAHSLDKRKTSDRAARAARQK